MYIYIGMHIYIYIYIYAYIDIVIVIYIYIERERDIINTYGGFYSVRVRKYHSEFVLLNGTIWGGPFVSPPRNKVTPNIVPFGVSVLAMVTNKIDPPI